MDRISRARASYAVAYFNVDDAIGNGNYQSCAAIPNRLRLIETRAHGVHGGNQTIAPELGQYVAHQVGTSFRLGHEALAGELSRRAFRAGRNQRRCHSHQHTARQQLRSRNVGNLQLARARVL